MNDLTDLEICKRIAGINGDKVLMMKSALGSNWMIAGEGHGGYKPYNPLTDDALCFKLMVKYKIDVVWVSSLLNNDDRVYAKNTALSNLVNEKPSRGTNKAICLAIIEAHKDD